MGGDNSASSSGETAPFRGAGSLFAKPLFVGYRRSISTQLLSAILLISSLVTLVTTSVQVAFDYWQEKGALEKSIELVRGSYSESVVESLWNMNDAQLRTEADGILTIPGIRYVEIWDKDKELLALGAPPPGKEALDRTFPLVYENSGEHLTLGRMRLVADLGAVLLKLRNKVLLIFFSQLVKTLVVSTLIFLTIRRLLTRHLVAITDYLKRLDFRSRGRNFALDRKVPRTRSCSSSDELDILASTINQMRVDLYSSYEEIRRFNQVLEQRVQERTTQLVRSQEVITGQQKALASSAKLSALGEMAGGMAHEINTPLAVIRTVSSQMQEVIAEGEPDKLLVAEMCSTLVVTTDRIAKIVSGLRSFSRDGSKDPYRQADIRRVVEETLSFCQERFKSHGIRLAAEFRCQDFLADCRETEISQVILNLLNNAYDAVEARKERWIKVLITGDTEWVEIHVLDSGEGIPADRREKIFQPFFTTKDVGKGTGLGLSISLGIVAGHRGELKLDETCPNTCFKLRLPRRQSAAMAV